MLYTNLRAEELLGSCSTSFLCKLFYKCTQGNATQEGGIITATLIIRVLVNRGRGDAIRLEKIENEEVRNQLRQEFIQDVLSVVSREVEPLSIDELAIMVSEIKKQQDAKRRIEAMGEESLYALVKQQVQGMKPNASSSDFVS